MSNFNEILSKEVTYDNIKIPEKQGFALSLEDTIFNNHRGGVKLSPHPSILRIKGEIPSITNLATTAALHAKINEVKSKIPSITNLAANRIKYIMLVI